MLDVVWLRIGTRGYLLVVGAGGWKGVLYVVSGFSLRSRVTAEGSVFFMRVRGSEETRLSYSRAASVVYGRGCQTRSVSLI